VLGLIWKGSKDNFPKIFWISLQIRPYTSFTPLFRWDSGSAEDQTVLGCLPKLFCALYCRAWATALLGLGLRIFQEQSGLVLKLLGPTIAPQNPSIRLPGWKGGFWQTRALNTVCLVQPRIYVSGFPPVQEVSRFSRDSV